MSTSNSNVGHDNNEVVTNGRIYDILWRIIIPSVVLHWKHEEPVSEILRQGERAPFFSVCLRYFPCFWFFFGEGADIGLKYPILLLNFPFCFEVVKKFA